MIRFLSSFYHCTGIYRERCAEMITDSVRAMILEQEGYAVTVAEFVGEEISVE